MAITVLSCADLPCAFTCEGLCGAWTRGNTAYLSERTFRSAQETPWKGGTIAEAHPCIPEAADEGLEAAATLKAPPQRDPLPKPTGMLKRAVASMDLRRQKIRRSLDARIGARDQG